MRTATWVRGIIVTAVAFAIAAISGCAGFFDPLPNSGGGGGTGPASGVFYVLNQTTNQLAGFSFAAGASSPTAVSGSPYTVTGPLAMAISPSGDFLYVSTISGITYYTVNSVGSLTASGVALSTDAATAMQVDPTGTWLVESTGAGILAAYLLNSTTGAFVGNAATVQLPSNILKGIAISPGGSSSPYVFVAMGTGGTEVVPFSAGSTSPFGTPGRLSVKNSLGADNTVAVDPQNRLLYVGETAAASGAQSGGLRVLTISNTGVTEITTGATDAAGNAYPYSTGGSGPSSILATANNVYVGNSAVSGSSAGSITGFSLVSSGTSYTMTTVNSVSTGPLTYDIAEDSTDTYILAVNFGGSPDLSTFTFNATTAGQLDAGPTAATGIDPVGAIAIVAAP